MVTPPQAPSSVDPSHIAQSPSIVMTPQTSPPSLSQIQVSTQSPLIVLPQTQPTSLSQTTQNPPSLIPQPLVKIIEIVYVKRKEHGLMKLFSTKYEQISIACFTISVFNLHIKMIGRVQQVQYHK